MNARLQYRNPLPTLPGAPGGASNTPGNSEVMQGGRQGELHVSQLFSKHYAANYRGMVFSTFLNAATVVAANVSPLAAGTGQPLIGLFNPANSGVNLVLLKTKYTTTSGTPGGPLLWNLIPNPANISQAASNPWNNKSLAQSGSAAKAFVNVALTGSTIGSAFRVLGGPAAVAAGAGNYSEVEQHDGDLIIPPGSMLALAATAAGTTHVLSAYCEWAEVPI